MRDENAIEDYVVDFSPRSTLYMDRPCFKGVLLGRIKDNDHFSRFPFPTYSIFLEVVQNSVFYLVQRSMTFYIKDPKGQSGLQ